VYQYWLTYFTPVGTYTTLANHVHVIRYVLHNIKVNTLTSAIPYLINHAKNMQERKKCFFVIMQDPELKF
jgi:hypothetical protein